MIFIFIILTSCVCAGTFVVNVTQTSYQAEEDQDITLEWTFTKPHSSINSLSITCKFITDQGSSILYHLHEGFESQDQQFAGRVQWDKDVLREGRLRLQVSRLRTDDSGLYLCAVLTHEGWSSATCRLKVTAAVDKPKPVTSQPATTTSKPAAESRGRVGLYVSLGVGLTAAAAAAAAAAPAVCRRT